jgi:hypothetical protein
MAPEWVTGVWRRELITLSDGTVDRSTLVYWGQTRSLYVDLRVPVDRRRISAAQSFGDLSARDIRLLARQRGFAGRIVIVGDRCTWFRDIDYQPDTGRPDTGRLRLDSDLLYETGEATSVIGAGYEEVYHRERRGDRLRAALRLVKTEGVPFDGRAGSEGILVLLDDRFLFARSREVSLPAAECLQSLIDDAGPDRNLVHAYLDCEVSLGTIGPHAHWQIDLSTIPFREGQRLFAPATSEITQAGSHLILRSSDAASHWEVCDTSVTLDILAATLAS